MRVSAIDLFLLELPLTEPFAASHGQTLSRTVTVVRITTGSGSAWGECSALPAATYTSESAADSFDALGRELGPLLIDQVLTAAEVVPLLADHRHRPMAVAALEMAVLDGELRSSGRSLAGWLGVERGTAAAGVSLGLDSVAATTARAVSLAEEGYSRVKVKIQPGHDLEPVTAIRRALPSIELHLDANGAYDGTDIDLLLELVGLGVDAVEQPFPPRQPDAASRLIERLTALAGDGHPVPIVADESVQSLADARDLLDRKAMTGLSIKPARVGGILTARSLHDLCLNEGLAATAGGMLETGLGRHALAALAGLPGFSLTGDLSPARRWLTVDPWPDLEMADGRISIPTGPGIAPDPDPAVLAEATIDHIRLGDDPET
ncbi:MAG: enolase C-terminal domain-like protein [Acidimicrobiales bacterium]